MKNHLSKILVVGAALSVCIGPVAAQGRGAGGGAAVGVGSPMGSVNGQAGMNGRFGGQSSANIGTQGRLNTNGPNASDRDFGVDRSADRTDAAANRDSANASAGANGNSQLGGLNAAHASDTARAHAASGSRVGEIGTYETDMKSALAISNPTQRNAAIVRARQKLAETSNKPLTSSAIAQLDSELKIQGASPTLGAVQ
jgi:hypothetical protein